MRLLVGFFRFWYDSLIGDSWEVAAGVALSLLVGILLVRHGLLPDKHLPPLLTGAVIVVLVGSVVVEARRKLPGAGAE